MGEPLLSVCMASSLGLSPSSLFDLLCALEIVDALERGQPTDDERRVVAMPSVDVEVRVLAADRASVHFLFARIIRRESYFRALLVQSRGTRVRPCPEKCGNPNASPKFRHCVRVPSFQGGAYAECVWQSHGSRCSHSNEGSMSAWDSGGSSAGGSPRAGPSQRVLPPSSSGSRLNPFLLEE
ncbi:hypothetical protein B0T26DRAFT_874062 [Lasiosphaeria miniovina]|uniref:Uncharacterized protein n=1 Tax=Lasiosphaeria miniovina TaxID=1954250 RepID=A0AA40ADX2_9PEZI|nr:uncharacterized protein B0T26DRAFT_874062 [Lasiosphaeria miniovina]KAK0714104.1 hypothetical protein B0T26DRAFT_874062 [Lasiosphaeria miniovina]